MALIYIVEDDGNILEIESYALENSGYSVKGFEHAQAFYEALREQLPDLVLLDIMLPEEDGISVLRQLRADQKTAALPVIMVTAKTSEIDIVRGLDLGADDYISKPFGILELLSRVKAVLRRTRTAPQTEILEFGEIRLEPERRLCLVDGKPAELTYKEYELLLCLLRNAGIVMKRDVLMERIWGVDFEGESRTLDMHIKTLRQKLGEASRFIQTVRNVGYTLRQGSGQSAG